MSGSIWVLAEQWKGQLSEITYELLALGRELADGLAVPLQAVLLGHQARAMAQTLGVADSVLYVDHPALAEPMTEPYCRALAQLLREKQPRCLLVPLTNVSMDVATLLPAELQISFLNWCKDVRVVDGSLQACCLLYGGKMEATAAVAMPAILGILAGARPADQGRVEKTTSIEELAVTSPEAVRVQFQKYIEPEAGDVDITKQDILVSVGRGIQSKENLALAQELAEALGGAVSASRPVIDQGWLPLSRQVGKSGATVKPKLYLALGISGAPEHVEGMKNSSLVIAINSDVNAPIFNVAHYGVAMDLFDLVPSLSKEIKARKGVRVA
jgi:electron transfer flavoprotein alpha subunit